MVEELMPDNIFNERMTSNEARIALFRAVEGKTKTEIAQLKNAYSKVLSAILKRETDLAAKGWFID